MQAPSAVIVMGVPKTANDISFELQKMREVLTKIYIMVYTNNRGETEKTDRS